MTMDEAYAWASQYPGIEVRRDGQSWAFYATFHTTDKRRRLYAGKSQARALVLRAHLVEEFAKSARRDPRFGER